MISKSLLFSFILISFSAFSQNSVSIVAVKNSLGENEIVNIVASIAEPQEKDIIIDFNYSGTAKNDYDFTFNFASKRGIAVAGGNGRGNKANQLDNPTAIYVDPAGNVYVSDYENHRVQKWAPGATEGTTVAGARVEGYDFNTLCFPQGLFVDENNNIYVSNYCSNRVQKWAPGAPEGVTVAGGNSEGSMPNQLSNPYGVFIDGAGNVYVADKLNHRVQKWAPGATQGVTVAGGKGAGSAKNQLNNPQDVLVDLSGNVFVADVNNNRIQKWAPGAVEGVTVAGGNLSGGLPNQLYAPYAVTFDREGNLIIADLVNYRIQKWGLNEKTGVTVTSGSDLPYKFQPKDVFVDQSGNLYIADDNVDQVLKYQLAPQIIIKAGEKTGTLTITGVLDGIVEPDETITLTPSKVTNGTLSNNDAITVTLVDTYMVSLALNGSSISKNSATDVILTATSNGVHYKDIVITFAAEGTAIVNSEYKLSSNTLTIPAGSTTGTIVISTKGIDDLVSERQESIILKVNTIENAIALTQSVSLNLVSDDKPNVSITSATSFKENSSLEITATLDNPNDYDAYVEFQLTGSAKDQLDYNTRFVSKQAPRIIIGAEYASRVNPRDVCVDLQGNVYVVDDNLDRVQKWSPGARLGVTVAGGNSYGYNANQLDNPTSVRVDAAGNIYVSDTYNNRIQKWAPGATSGVTVAGGNGKGSAANQLSSPMGMHIDAQGNIYVADRVNHRIQKWAPGATSGVTVAGGNGSGPGANQLFYPDDVSVDKTGNIFIADQFNDRVQKWAPGATSGETLITGVFADGVFADDAGSIYVVANNQVKKWPAVKPVTGEYSGIRVAGSGNQGYQVTDLNFPNDVFVDKWGNIFTADYHNYRIQKMQYAPQVLIKAGETTATLTLEGIDNILKEGNKTITYTPITVGNCILSNMSGTTVTLVDDEFTTGIFDNDKAKQLSSYPNPTTGLFYIVVPGNENNVKVSVRNVTGTLLSDSEMQVPTNRIIDLNISNHNPGVYFISIQSSTLNHMVKVVKN